MGVMVDRATMTGMAMGGERVAACMGILWGDEYGWCMYSLENARHGMKAPAPRNEFAGESAGNPV